MNTISDAVLTCEAVSAGYNGTVALVDATLSVPRAARVAVLGPNGAGKSTLFKAVAGLLPVRSGRLLVRGKPVGARGSEVAYVPQREEVDWQFPVSVSDVVMMGRYGRLGLLRRAGVADHAAVRMALEEVGLSERADTRISDLSGGQQQRVFLARALAQESDILLLDEPFTGVDAATEASLFTLLDRLRQRQITAIIATHDLNKALSHFDLLLCVRREVVAYGPPQEVFTPDVLRRTFGEQLTLWPHEGETMIVTDGHHRHGDLPMKMDDHHWHHHEHAQNDMGAGGHDHVHE